MNSQVAIVWMNALKNEWKSHNLEGVINLFSNVEEYFEGPFSTPVSSQEDVMKLWVDTDYQDIDVLDINLIAFEEGRCAMQWHLKYKDKRDSIVYEMDGTYEVHFNDEGQCKYFKQWWVMAY